MKNKSILILLLAFGLCGLNSSANEADSKSQKIAATPGIEGIWQLTRITVPKDGKPGFESAPEGYAEALKISFKDGKMTMIPGEPGYTRFTYTADSEKEPKQLTWKPAELREEKGGDALAIYKIEGDKITIMIQDEKRPVDFDRTKSASYEGKRVVEKKAEAPKPEEKK